MTNKDNDGVHGKYGCWWEGGTGVSPEGNQCGECYPNYEDKCPHLKKYRQIEVVRCKDCKFNVANMEKDPLDITDYSGDDIVCSYFMTDGLEPMDFCSYGEMKGDAE